MLKHLHIIIADFYREYHIDFCEAAYTMPSDKFFVLLGGLSQKSLFMQTLAQKKKEPTETIRTPQDFAALFRR